MKYIEWAAIREEILARDKWQCRLCRKRDVYPYRALEVDHIKPKTVIYDEMVEEFNKLSRQEQRKTGTKRKFWIKFLKKANRRSNLRTLCADCHHKITARFNSMYKSQINAERRGKMSNPNLAFTIIYNEGYHSMTELSNFVYSTFPHHHAWFKDDVQKLTQQERAENAIHEFYQDKKNLPYYGFSLWIETMEKELLLSEPEDTEVNYNDIGVLLIGRQERL